MTIGYVECPECEKETEIDYEGVSQSEEFTCICEKCKKEFLCYWEVSHDYYPRKKGASQ